MTFFEVEYRKNGVS